jgi:hypothetical protein
MFDFSRPELRVCRIPIWICRRQNPAASTGQSVSYAYGIGSRSNATKWRHRIELKNPAHKSTSNNAAIF